MEKLEKIPVPLKTESSDKESVDEPVKELTSG